MKYSKIQYEKLNSLKEKISKVFNLKTRANGTVIFKYYLFIGFLAKSKQIIIRMLKVKKKTRFTFRIFFNTKQNDAFLSKPSAAKTTTVCFTNLDFSTFLSLSLLFC